VAARGRLAAVRAKRECVCLRACEPTMPASSSRSARSLGYEYLTLFRTFFSGRGKLGISNVITHCMIRLWIVKGYLSRFILATGLFYFSNEITTAGLLEVVECAPSFIKYNEELNQDGAGGKSNSKYKI